MKLLISIISLFICFSLNTALGASKNTEITPSLNHIMAKIGGIMVDIYPLVVAQRELKKREIEKIDQSLDKLTELFKSAKPFMALKSDGYQISYEFVLGYIKIVKSVLATYHVDYARSYLYALGEICASCHTQDTTLRTLFSGSQRSHFANDYTFAEFNFVTRNYDEAINYYQKFLDNPKTKTEVEIIQPLQRSLTVFVQVKNNPGAGIKFLKKYVDLKDHTTETKNQVQAWMAGLNTLNNSGVSTLSNINFASLESYVKKYLGEIDTITFSKPIKEEDEILRVWLRGQLYHYLNRQASPDEIPKLLYWLSVTDRSIAYNFYFSLADLYLKQCVLKYPKHAYAKRCLNEYKSFVKHTYEMKVPAGIKQELINLENALK